MKVHGCTSCGTRFPIYGGLQEHLLTHRTVCRMCNRAFTRRANLLKHKCETAGDLSCESCRRTFSTRHTLKRHLRDTSCSQPQPPEPKRQRVSGCEEDPVDLTQHVHGCTYCGARFPIYGILQEHLGNPSGKGRPSVRKTRMMLLYHHRNKILIYRTCLQNTGQESAHTWREFVFKQDTITDLKITILGR